MRIRILLAVLAFAPACAPYVPGGFNVPMLQQARDIHLNAQLGTNGVQANAAVALTDHIAVRGTGQYASFSTDMTDAAGNKAQLPSFYRMYSGGLSYFVGKTTEG